MHKAPSGLFLVVSLAACYEVAPLKNDAVMKDSVLGLDSGQIRVPLTPLAPSNNRPMFQGSQHWFLSKENAVCTSRTAASISDTAFCFLAADDNVKCAGTTGGVNFGATFQVSGQQQASQIILMSRDNGLCITRKDNKVFCLGTNTQATGLPVSNQFTQWSNRSDIVAIGSGTWDQLCALTLTGEVICSGFNFGSLPITVAAAGKSRFWVDSFGNANIDDPNVFRPGDDRGECTVRTAGLFCNGTSFGPNAGRVVSGNLTSVVGPEQICWLDTAGTVSCNIGPRFAPNKVLLLATSSYSASMCAIYNDGSVWCIGPNDAGKFGTGNMLKLDQETMIAPPSSARIACDP